MWKDFFHYSKGQQRGILVLFSLIGILFAAYLIQRQRLAQLTPEVKTGEKYQQFLAQLQQTEQPESKPAENPLFYFNPNTATSATWQKLGLSAKQAQVIIKYRNKGGRFYQKNDLARMYVISDAMYERLKPWVKITPDEPTETESADRYEAPRISETFTFNPNTLPFDSLLLLGLSERTAQSIVNYREAGGSFATPADFGKIYTLSQQDFERLRKLITIPPEMQPVESLAGENQREPQKQALSIDLNTADTATLKRLYGIGDYFANGIVKYRALLGGYHSKEQLLEVYNLDQDTYELIQSQVYARPKAIQTININTASFKALLRHPYLTYYHTVEITRLREQNPIQSVDTLRKLKILSEPVYEKVYPYLTTH